MSSLNLSSYQSSVIEFALNGNGNGCINAVAGSGKSTTLRLVAYALRDNGVSPSDMRVIVFGRENAKELQEKFGKEYKDSISTLHSAGYQILREYLGKKLSIGSKYYYIAGKTLGYISYKEKTDKSWTKGSLKENGHIGNDKDFQKLLELLRSCNLEPSTENVRKLCDHYQLEKIYNYSVVAQASADCLAAGEKAAREKGSIDFTDMIYLPVKWQLRPGIDFKTFSFVMVDECQDLNRTQLELACMLAGDSGRMLFVGDRKQAIMGFAGADCNSYQNIVDRVNGQELPLLTCYRCPSSHLSLVRKLFPSIPIEARDNAPIGEIKITDENELHKLLKDGDMILGRKTAPLVSQCIKLISKKVAAKVKGRDIGEQIKGDIEDISKMKGFNFENFSLFVDEYKEAKLNKLLNKENSEQLIELLNDRVDCITAIYDNCVEAESVKDLYDYIDSLFSDESSPITLCTAHRSKGLENDRIFILKPNDFPLTWKEQRDWQLEQENNLLYVALTRAKQELWFIGAPNWYSEDLSHIAALENKPIEEIKERVIITPPPAIEKTVTIDPMIEAFGKKIKPLLSDLDREDMLKLADYIKSLAATMSD